MFYGCLLLDNPMLILEQSVFGFPHESLRFGDRNATLDTEIPPDHHATFLDQQDGNCIVPSNWMEALLWQSMPAG
jgi:hypothetical protein